ncbi:MAG: hypothetical protein ACREA0_29605, partial [bacterium]
LMLLVVLVPVQTTVLAYLSVGGIRPDVCLVAAVLVGATSGSRAGMLFGFAVGFLQDQFTAGVLGLNLVTKGLAGLLAGLVWRYLANLTPVTVVGLVLVLSAVTNLVFFVAGLSDAGPSEAVARLQSILLPQAVFDAVIGVCVYWLIVGRGRPEAAEPRPSSPLWVLK